MVSTNGLTISRDQEGRIKTLTLAPGKTVTYHYNSRGFVSQVRDWVGGFTNLIYDNAGRLTSIARSVGVTTTYTYDNDGRLASINEGNLSSITLTRDAAGQITVANRSVSLDPDPDLGTESFTYNDASEVSGYTYDNMGRLTSDGSRTYTWDLASRLVSYTEGGSTTDFTYDGFGMVLTRGRQEYVWNYGLGLPSISVLREGGQDVRYYVHTPDGKLLYSIEAINNSRRFYHFDEIGSTLFLTDDTGTVTDSYAYTPYGVLTDSSGTTDNPFTYIGQYGVMQVGTTGLYRMRQRVYDSSTQRFVSREPIFDRIHPLTANPYQYAAGNPVSFIDPNGEDPQTDTAGLAANVVSVLSETFEQTASTSGVKTAGKAGGPIGTAIGAATEVAKTNERMDEVCDRYKRECQAARDRFDAMMEELRKSLRRKINPISRGEYEQRRREYKRLLEEQLQRARDRFRLDSLSVGTISALNILTNVIPGAGLLLDWSDYIEY
jgi:RHS repeat-associated protein